MKKGLSLLMSLLMVISIISSVPVTSSAASTSDLTFELNDDGKSYSVTDCKNSASGALTIPATYNGLPVTKVTLAAFRYCDCLTSITIPDGVTSISDRAFMDCTSLTSIQIPDSVTNIGEDAFINTGYYNAAGNWKNGVLYIGNHIIEAKKSLSGAYVIKGGTKNIVSRAFNCCTSLTSITIPDSVTSIGFYAFGGCTSLNTITIGNGVTSIGDHAFCGCTSLKTINIPDSVTSIGVCAFRDCSSLTSIKISDSVTSLGSDAFANTGYYNTTDNWEAGVLYIGNYLIDAKTTLRGKYKIKDGTKNIPNYIFRDCISLTSITIPDSVTSIGNSAFYDCTSLTSATIGNSVTSIGNSAFYGCTSLKSINIPDSVISIDARAFEYCTSLTSIKISDSVTSIGIDAFSNTGFYKNMSNWDNGVLYIGKHLIDADHSINGTFKIKNGTKTISDYAFHYDNNDSCVYDDEYDYDCNCEYNFQAVIVPESVTKIGEKAIGYHDVFFMSDEDEDMDYWAPVKIHDFVIIGAKGSAAETYANKEGFIFVECNHPSTQWVTTQKATVYKSGSKQSVCTQCGKVLKTAKIPQLKCATPKLKSVVNTATGVKITWNKVAGGDMYTVLRKTGKGKWVAIKGSIKNNYYIDKTAKSGVTYKYTVKAKNEAGFSAYNTTGLTIKCLADPVLKTPTSAKKGITLKWNKITGAQGYVVYRKAGNGKLTRLATVKGISKISYLDKSAKKNVKYTYQVRAYNGKTYSAYSNSKIIKDKY